MTLNPPRYKVVLAFAAVYVIWGSTYLAIRFSIETLPPFLMTGIRFLVGGVLLYGWLRWRGVPAPRGRYWGPAIIMGLLMPAGGTGLVAWAEQTVPSGLTALLVATVPLWVVSVDWICSGGVKPTRSVVIGLILGFAGVTLLVNPVNIGGLRDVDVFGALVVVAASMFWAVGSIYSRQARQPGSKLMTVSMQMMAGGVALVLISLTAGEHGSFQWVSVSLKSWLSLVYLITAGSVAFAAYVWLLSAVGAARAATYAYVNPVIALILGAVAAGETLGWWALTCSAVVIIAVIIIVSAKTKELRVVNAEKTAPPCSLKPCAGA